MLYVKWNHSPNILTIHLLFKPSSPSLSLLSLITSLLNYYSVIILFTPHKLNFIQLISIYLLLFAIVFSFYVPHHTPDLQWFQLLTSFASLFILVSLFSSYSPSYSSKLLFPSLFPVTPPVQARVHQIPSYWMPQLYATMCPTHHQHLHHGRHATPRKIHFTFLISITLSTTTRTFCIHLCLPLIS